MSHELTLQEIAEFSRDFNADPKNQVIARAAGRSGVLEAALRLPPLFLLFPENPHHLPPKGF